MKQSMWSSVIPDLQIAWDSTSLKAFMACPRQWYYAIHEGWRFPGNVDTDFGGFFASSVECFKKALLSGRSKEQATLDALRYVLQATYPEGKPWGGRYDEQWRCTGTNLYRNGKGNRAKCPWSHKGVWLPSPAPDVCGECGSPCETQRRWVPDHNTKDRYTLVRLVAWYCDEQAGESTAGPVPYSFPNGQPAVELSFVLPLPIRPLKQPGLGEYPAEYYDEPYLLCGHIDSIMQFGAERFISDNKTTKNALTPAYFAQYSPNVQVDTYDLAGSVLWPDLALKGVMIEAAQTLTEGARFGVGVMYRTEGQRAEYLEELEWWLRQAEKCAKEGYWPKNRASCYMCQFKMVCSKDKDQRERYLQSNFTKSYWNPLDQR